MTSRLHIKVVALQRDIEPETTSFVCVKPKTPFRFLPPLPGGYLAPNETTCRVVLILTANIYKNKQPQTEPDRETRLYRSQTQGIPIFLCSPLGRSFLFKYSRGRLIIAPLDLRLLCQQQQVAGDELELKLEQLRPNPIIIALIKNKFSILRGVVSLWLSLHSLTASPPISPIWQFEPHNRFKASPFIFGEGRDPPACVGGELSALFGICRASSSITSSLIEGEIAQRKKT